MASVFVSYSHDSPEHKARVLALAHRLLAAGYDVRLDRFTGHPSGEGWPQWMCRQMREADKIVCVCTPNYRARFEGDERVGGLGVSWEGHLLTTDLYLNRGRTDRVLPVFASSEDEVPFVLRAHSPRALDDVDGLVDALGGVVGPARPVPADGEGIREIVSVGRLLAPLFRPPRKYQGVAGYLPSQLLRPEHAIVPFMGRADVVADLDAWCLGGGPRVRVLHGPGGAGKTRLALEVAARRAVEGWRAGPLAWRSLSDEALDELFRDPIPLFLIVDYAETRPVEVAQLLRRLGDNPEASARVLLLARGMGDWWRNLNDAVRELEGLASGAAPVQVDRMADGHAHAFAAARAFAGWLGKDAPRSVPDRGCTPLERQVEGLLAVMGGGTEGWDGLLGHEREYLRRAGEARRVALPIVECLPAAMALVTLAGGVDAGEATNWLGVVDGLQDLRIAERKAVVGMLSALYPRPEGGIDGVRPDRVGEALVADADRNGGLAASAVDRGRVKAALTLLTRLGAAGKEGPLRWLVEARRAAVAEVVIEVAQETGDPVGRVMAESLAARPDVYLARAMARAVPVSTVALRELGVVAGWQAAGGAKDEKERARFLNSLAVDLAGTGRREEALKAIEEAVAIRRRLAAARPEAFRPVLASSLNNLSNRLSALGRREDALAAIEEAVAIRRRLAAARPDAFLPDLASSLNNLSIRLSGLGRREDALAAIEEAVAIYRRLAAAHPDAFLPVLASSLNNLSGGLSDLGRREDALAASEEAVAIRRRLAAARPDAFLPNLASSLNNLSNRLSTLGRREDALATIEEAVAIYRRLAAARPDAFLPDLATSLWSRALILMAVDSHAAAASAAEALRTYIQLARRFPGAFGEKRDAVRQAYGKACVASCITPDPELLGD